METRRAASVRVQTRRSHSPWAHDGRIDGRLAVALDETRRRMVRQAIAEMGSVAGAARWLGLTRACLYKMVRVRLGVDHPFDV